jgi:replicative superfamily II helicase
MYQITEAERLFHEEVRDKKRTASGVHSKTGRNGYVGNMRFPSDIMSRKEKYNYRRASKVMVTNVFDKILPMSEFNQLEAAEQKNRMTHWRNTKTNKEIRQEMGISNSRYYDIVKELDLPKAPRVMKEPKTPKKKTPQAAKKQEETLPAKVEEAAPVQQIIINGLHLSFNGTYKPEQIQRQLEKFSLMLEDEKDDFYVELKLMQK